MRAELDDTSLSGETPSLLKRCAQQLGQQERIQMFGHTYKSAAETLTQRGELWETDDAFILTMSLLPSTPLRLAASFIGAAEALTLKMDAPSCCLGQTLAAGPTLCSRRHAPAWPPNTPTNTLTC